MSRYLNVIVIGGIIILGQYLPRPWPAVVGVALLIIGLVGL